MSGKKIAQTMDDALALLKSWGLEVVFGKP